MSSESWQFKCAELKQRGAYLYQSKLWADCTFRLVGDPGNYYDVTIKAHKVFMAMASPVFADLLYRSFVRYPVHIYDVRPEVFNMLLEYIYSDNLNINSSKDACDLYHAAKKWKLPHVAKCCASYLNDHMSPENVCNIYKVACDNEDSILLQTCEKVFKAKTKEILKDNSFCDVDLSIVKKLFTLEPLNINSELDLFNAAVSYAVFQEGKSKTRNVLKRIDNENVGEISPPKKLRLALDTNDNLDISMSGDEVSPNSGECDKASAETETPKQNIPRTSPIKDKQKYRELVSSIRFLSLTPQQLAGCENLSTLLTEEEILALLMNAANRETVYHIPPGFSTTMVPRTLSTKEDRTRLAASFRFLIQNFENIQQYESPYFYLRNLAWSLMVVAPHGYSDAEHMLAVGVTCFLDPGIPVPPEWLKNAKVKVKFSTHKSVPKCLHKIPLKFGEQTDDYCIWVKGIDRRDILNPLYGFVDELKTVAYKVYVNTVPRPEELYESDEWTNTSHNSVEDLNFSKLLLRRSKTPVPVSSKVSDKVAIDSPTTPQKISQSTLSDEIMNTNSRKLPTVSTKELRLSSNVTTTETQPSPNVATMATQKSPIVATTQTRSANVVTMLTQQSPNVVAMETQQSPRLATTDKKLSPIATTTQALQSNTRAQESRHLPNITRTQESPQTSRATIKQVQSLPASDVITGQLQPLYTGETTQAKSQPPTPTLSKPPATPTIAKPPPSPTLSIPPATPTISKPPPTPTLSIPPATRTVTGPPPTRTLSIPPATPTITGPPPTPTLSIPPATPTITGPPPTPTLSIPPATPTITGPPPTPTLSIPPATLTITGPPPTPTLSIPPATPTITGPPPTPTLSIPPATLTITGPPPTPTLSIPPATPTITGPPPTRTLSIPPATPTITGPPPTRTLSIPPATPIISKPPPTPTLSIPPATRTITGSLPTRTLSIPPATSTITGPPPTPTLSIPPATSTITGPPPTPTLSIPPATLTITGPPPTPTLSIPPATPTITGPPPTRTLSIPPATPTITGPPPTRTLSIPPATPTILKPPPTPSLSIPPATRTITGSLPTRTLSIPPATPTITGPRPTPTRLKLPSTPTISKPPPNSTKSHSIIQALSKSSPARNSAISHLTSSGVSALVLVRLLRFGLSPTKVHRLFKAGLSCLAIGYLSLHERMSQLIAKSSQPDDLIPIINDRAIKRWSKTQLLSTTAGTVSSLTAPTSSRTSPKSSPLSRTPFTESASCSSHQSMDKTPFLTIPGAIDPIITSPATGSKFTDLPVASPSFCIRNEPTPIQSRAIDAPDSPLNIHLQPEVNTSLSQQTNLIEPQTDLEITTKSRIDASPPMFPCGSDSDSCPSTSPSSPKIETCLTEPTDSNIPAEIRQSLPTSHTPPPQKTIENTPEATTATQSDFSLNAGEFHDTITVPRALLPATIAEHTSAPLHATTLPWPIKRTATLTNTSGFHSSRTQKVKRTKLDTSSIKSSEAEKNNKENDTLEPVSEDENPVSKEIGLRKKNIDSKEVYMLESGTHPKALQEIALTNIKLVLEIETDNNKNPPTISPKSLMNVALSELKSLIMKEDINYSTQTNQDNHNIFIKENFQKSVVENTTVNSPKSLKDIVLSELMSMDFKENHNIIIKKKFQISVVENTSVNSPKSLKDIVLSELMSMDFKENHNIFIKENFQKSVVKNTSVNSPKSLKDIVLSELMSMDFKENHNIFIKENFQKSEVENTSVNSPKSLKDIVLSELISMDFKESHEQIIVNHTNTLAILPKTLRDMALLKISSLINQ